MVHFVFLCFFALSGHDFSFVQGKVDSKLNPNVSDLDGLKASAGQRLSVFLSHGFVCHR